MRKIIVTIATLALIGSFSTVYAMSVGAGGGWFMGMGMKNFENKMGIMNFGGGVVIGVMPLLSIEGGFDYHMKYLNKEVGESGGIDYIPADAFKTTMMTFGGGARINFIPEGAFRPFAGGGMNFYLMKSKDNKPDEDPIISDSSSNKPGVYFGGGINYFINDSLALHVPVKLHMIFTEGNKPLLLTFGAGIEYFFM
ncbi:MAG: outer membrane beta-barrel protein [bacterium]